MYQDVWRNRGQEWQLPLLALWFGWSVNLSGFCKSMSCEAPATNSSFFSWSVSASTGWLQRSLFCLSSECDSSPNTRVESGGDGCDLCADSSVSGSGYDALWPPPEAVAVRRIHKQPRYYLVMNECIVPPSHDFGDQYLPQNICAHIWEKFRPLNVL